MRYCMANLRASDTAQLLLDCSHVFNGPFKMLFVANVSVEIIFDPKLADSPQHFVSLMRSKRLKRVQNIAQFVLIKSCQQGMNVIWHHYP